jgi:hypothetical protein
MSSSTPAPSRRTHHAQSSNVSSIVHREQEQMQRILDSDNFENTLIFAPTQVGKLRRLFFLWQNV